MTAANPPPAESALFRAQALRARHLFYEQPLRLRCPGLQRTALVLITGVLMAVVWLLQQPYREQLTVSGYTDRGPGEVAVRAPLAAQVTELAVREGETVAAGALLLRLSTDLHVGDGHSAAGLRSQALAAEAEALQRSVALATQRQQQAAQSLARQQQQGKQLRSVLRSERRAARVLAQLDEGQLQNMTRLLARGAISDAEHRGVQRQRLLSEQALRASARALAQHDTQMLQLRSQQRQLANQAAAALAAAHAAQARLQVRRIDRGLAADQILRAPVAGTVSALNAHAGQRLETGRRLLTLLAAPALPAQVTLLLPAQTLGTVVAGQSVQLRYAGYPYPRFGAVRGRIVEISRSPTRAAELPVPAPAALVYRARVLVHTAHSAGFDPAAAAPGMPVVAAVQLRAVPLWRRLLAPLDRFRQPA